MILKIKLILFIILIIILIPHIAFSSKSNPSNFIFCCEPNNDLYMVMKNRGFQIQRFDEIEEGIAKAPSRSGVLILADGYPTETTTIDPIIFKKAADEKQLRIYIEYPKALPELELAEPRRTNLERAVIASDVFGPSLEKLRILAIHDCHFIPTEWSNASIVAACVAGFDTAVFGLDDVTTYPILFEHPFKNVLVSTTKLSQFVTARYAPKDAWQAIWNMILNWLQPDGEIPKLD